MDVAAVEQSAPIEVPDAPRGETERVAGSSDDAGPPAFAEPRLAVYCGHCPV